MSSPADLREAGRILALFAGHEPRAMEDGTPVALDRLAATVEAGAYALGRAQGLLADTVATVGELRKRLDVAERERDVAARELVLVLARGDAPKPDALRNALRGTMATSHAAVTFRHAGFDGKVHEEDEPCPEHGDTLGFEADRYFPGEGWDCPNAPRACEYDMGNDPHQDRCIHCGDPYERK